MILLPFCIGILLRISNLTSCRRQAKGEDVEKGCKLDNMIPTPRTSWFQEPVAARVAESTYVSPTATILGDVEIGEDVYVAPAVSIRGDEGTPIHIGDKTNVQDGVIMHGLLHQWVRVEGRDYAIYVGDEVCCAHGAIIHGPCVVGDNTFIGFNAVIFKAEVGRDCAVLHNAVVTGGVKVPDGRMVPIASIVDTQAKADALPSISEDLRSLKEEVVEVNIEFARGYKKKVLLGDRA